MSLSNPVSTIVTLCRFDPSFLTTKGREESKLTVSGKESNDPFSEDSPFDFGNSV